MSFAKNIGKNISKYFSDKYSHKLLNHAKQSATNALKTSLKRVIQTTVGAAGNLIGNKIANKITKILKTSQQKNSETVTNEHDKEIPKERYISSEQSQKTIDDIRLIQQYNNGISKNDEFTI